MEHAENVRNDDVKRNSYPLFSPTRGTASDVAGTMPATMSWNTLSDSRIVMPIHPHTANTTRSARLSHIPVF